MGFDSAVKEKLTIFIRSAKINARRETKEHYVKQNIGKALPTLKRFVWSMSRKVKNEKQRTHRVEHSVQHWSAQSENRWTQQQRNNQSNGRQWVEWVEWLDSAVMNSRTDRRSQWDLREPTDSCLESRLAYIIAIVR